MALRWNMVTGQVEDDGVAAPDPRDALYASGALPRPQAPPPGLPGSAVPPPADMPSPLAALFNQAPPAPAPQVLPPAPEPVSPPVPEAPKPRRTGGGGGTPGLGNELTEAGGIAADKQSAAAQLTEAMAATAGNKADAATNAALAAEQLQHDAAERAAAKQSEFERLNTIAAQEEDKAKSQTFRSYWADKSTGTKLLSTISVALGTMAQAFGAAGGINIPNTALQELNRDMEQDWLIQKANLEKQEHVAEASRRNAHDAAIAMETAHAQYLASAKEHTAAMVEKAALANGSQEARAKGAVMSASLREEAQQSRQKAEMGRAQLAEVRSQTAKNYAEAAAAGARGDKATAGTEVYGPDGKVLGVTKTPKQAETVNKASPAYRDLINSLDALDKSYASGRVSPLGADASKRDALKSQAAISYKTVAELGALSGPDMGLIDGVLGKGGAIYARDPRPAIRQAKQMLIKRQEALAASNGIDPGRYGDAWTGGGAPTAGGRPKIDPTDKARMVDFVMKNPGDPRSARIKALLQGQ